MPYYVHGIERKISRARSLAKEGDWARTCDVELLGIVPWKDEDGVGDIVVRKGEDGGLNFCELGGGPYKHSVFWTAREGIARRVLAGVTVQRISWSEEKGQEQEKGESQ